MMRYLVVRTENLTKLYGRRQALANLTIEVEPGEIYGILGPKGAGKSTLIHILLDLVRPTRGQALVLGLDCQRQGVQVRQQIGFLPEKLQMNLSATGEMWLQSLTRLRRSVDMDLASSLAARFELNLTRPIREYSEEERKILGIIQAMIPRPELMIFDEPCAGLGRKAKNTLFQLFNEIRAEGRTILIASDSLTDMERICDRVAVLHQGRLIAVERGVQLRARALRIIEMRFSTAVNREFFANMPNVNDLVLEDNKVRCTVQGDPDALIKLASQYRVMDIISQQPTLEEVYRTYYGIGPYAG
jgi:ABC-2 type transport system ATP-binding protein